MRSVSPELPLSEAVIEAMKAIPPKGRLSRSEAVRCPFPKCRLGIRSRLGLWAHFRERHTYVLDFPELVRQLEEYRSRIRNEVHARHFQLRGIHRQRLRKEVRALEAQAREAADRVNAAREKLGWVPVEIREKEAIPA